MSQRTGTTSSSPKEDEDDDDDDDDDCEGRRLRNEPSTEERMTEPLIDEP
eukprot:CAMPEP_0202053282 /NCGR_PEP_ID=MMETSP0963-20130614/5768_1 /ASSEMBLY_ACC=CAM_ASM_000494 /TAXON_ID=4773 /ORGANISM="Schizochytrium aggregatum, Strain ATCC28209" /LENGTH=49 /DNA_ID=CAMNT_0048618609 /DNA_START=307 /DNA_END=456 /DNA_ORIENTATION=+